VYENAMRVELERQGLAVASQVPIKVYYEGVVVGDYVADLCVEDAVIVELKAANALDRAHEAQLMNYLRATGMQVGLLLNFGPKAEFSRKVFTSRAPANAANEPTDVGRVERRA
jgi:GxxExxY protein